MSLVSKFASVGSATMASRVLGFVREALIAGVLGVGPVTDAFYAALRFPNLFRRLFAEGAFNTAFIPLFARELEGGGESAARRFADDVLSVLVPVLLLLTGLAILAMPVLVATIIAPGFVDSPEKFDLTVIMTKIMFPYLFCMSLVAMFSGILNSMRRYFLAAFTPVLLNIILIGVLVSAKYMALEWHAGWLVAGLGRFCFRLYSARISVLGGSSDRLFHGYPAAKNDTCRSPTADPHGPGRSDRWRHADQSARWPDDCFNPGQGYFLSQPGRPYEPVAIGRYRHRIGVVLLPELSRSLKAGNTSDAQHLQNRSLEFSLGLSLPGGGCLRHNSGAIDRTDL